MSQAEGIMLRGSRIIVPTSMRREMKSRIREGHLVNIVPEKLFHDAAPILNLDENSNENQCNRCHQQLKPGQELEPTCSRCKAKITSS
jgi:uncharacterized paraquat-inducible protein A